MNRIECSVWNNGGMSWGLKILGGREVRSLHFDRTQSPVFVELDGTPFSFNIDKKSFWTSGCGEIIGVPLRTWIMKYGLTSGDRVWLEVMKPRQTFKAVPHNLLRSEGEKHEREE